jgi:mono/diheme cytochrome c family protein
MYYPNDKPSYAATLLPVKSAIARPTANATVGGSVLISGFAWSGTGRIARVEVSADGGASWTAARLLEPNDPRAWVRWSLLWQAPGNGSYTLMSRATDESGAVQPVTVEWNRLGYGYNAIQGVPITVGGAAAMAPAEAPASSAALEAPSGAAPAPVAASAGAAVYGEACARCHGDQGEGSVDAPRIIGPNTLPHASTKEELFQYVKANMPYDNPGTLSDAEYQAAVDFLRQANGLP